MDISDVEWLDKLNQIGNIIFEFSSSIFLDPNTCLFMVMWFDLWFDKVDLYPELLHINLVFPIFLAQKPYIIYVHISYVIIRFLCS